MKSYQENYYDAIVIGSGMGGLTTAALLARLNKKRVLLLEQHWVLGGQTHTFKRKGKYKWSVGLHYVGEMEESNILRQMLDYVTDGKLQWEKMPDVYDKFIYPHMQIDVSCIEEDLVANLVREFPDEEAGIRRYFSDIRRGRRWFKTDFVAKCFPGIVGSAMNLINKRGRRKFLATTQSYLDSIIKDQRLKAILATKEYIGFCLPPDKSAFAFHSFLATHYLGGGYYPVGGTDQIAKTIVPIIEAHGGDCMINHEVTEIITEGRKAVGVRANYKKGGTTIPKEFYAPLIISNVGIYDTYKYLLPPAMSQPTLGALQQLQEGVSFVSLYIGFTECPRTMGFTGANHWIIDGYDHSKIFSEKTGVLEGKVDACYLSFSSLKNPAATSHTAELLTMVNYNDFVKWSEQEWQNRDEEYYKLKDKITAAMLDLVEKYHPGFKKNVAFTELSTPLSVEKFTKRSKGMIYGTPLVPARFELNCFQPKTPLKNFYLTGSDVTSLGVIGAFFGGITTASVLNGPLGFLKIVLKAKLEAWKRKRVNKKQISANTTTNNEQYATV